jgi:hypothetical protein
MRKQQSPTLLLMSTKNVDQDFHGGCRINIKIPTPIITKEAIKEIIIKLNPLSRNWKTAIKQEMIPMLPTIRINNMKGVRDKRYFDKYALIPKIAIAAIKRIVIAAILLLTISIVKKEKKASSILLIMSTAIIDMGFQEV